MINYCYLDTESYPFFIIAFVAKRTQKFNIIIILLIQQVVPGLLVGSMVLNVCTSVHQSAACMYLSSSDGISLFSYPGMYSVYIITTCTFHYTHELVCCEIIIIFKPVGHNQFGLCRTF